MTDFSSVKLPKGFLFLVSKSAWNRIRFFYRGTISKRAVRGVPVGSNSVGKPLLFNVTIRILELKVEPPKTLILSPLCYPLSPVCYPLSSVCYPLSPMCYP